MRMSLFGTLAAIKIAKQLNNTAVQTVQQNNNSTVCKCKVTQSISAEKYISANGNNNSP